MPTTDALAGFLDAFLLTKEVDDPYCLNGLQVPGQPEVNKVACGVTASRGFLQQAADWGADAVLVHHGLFWRKGVRAIDPLLSDRLKLLYQHEMALLAYHLPLDAHAEVGNNACITQALQAALLKMQGISAIAEFAEPLTHEAFCERCASVFGQPPVFAAGQDGTPVKRVGICSGGGADFAYELAGHGIDTFLTGEISERHWHDLHELGLNFVVCGHYATETFGIKALMPVLKKQFPHLELSFFSEPCPV